METGKPWWASQTILSGIGGSVASLGGAYMAFKAGNIELALSSAVAAMMSLGAIAGRLKAVQPIGKPVAAAPK
jgi:hypothetical protein